MPSAVRSNQYLIGLPNLNDKDQELVNKHNVLFRRAMKWAKLHQQSGGRGYIENRLTSMLWKTKNIRGVLNSGLFELVRYDMCQ